jgi:hypothetical protein
MKAMKTNETEIRFRGKNFPAVMVRTYSAGVFFGGLKSREGKEVILVNARRVWYWKGAASLSQLAQAGPKYPNECKFPMAVSEVTLLEAIEIIPITANALKILNKVPVWEI